MNTPLRIGLGLVLVLSTTACAGRSVSRISPDETVDLSGRWNDTDSRLVAEAMIEQSLQSEYGPSWAARHAQANGGSAPTIIVGSVRNRGMEHIPVGTFVRELERAFVNSGVVRVVASSEERSEIREEREDQQYFARPETQARLAAETGANYMLQGDIDTIHDRERGRSVTYYQVDLTLVDLQSNEKTWVGQHRIKKLVDRSRFRI